MGDVFNQGIHQMLSPGVCIMTLKLAIKDGLSHYFSDPRYGCIFLYSIVDRYNSHFELNHECITLLNSI